MRSRKEVGLVILRHIVDITVVIKTFKFSLTSDLHELADDADENQNYVSCLFFP